VKNTAARRIQGIYGILPPDLPLATLLAKAEAALAGGVRMLQLRDKAQTHASALERARRLRALVRSCGGRLFVNDSVELACTADADGVHLGRGDIEDAPALPGPRRLILGVSCRGDPDFARRMLLAGADYVSFGAVFQSRNKPESRPIGLNRLAELRQLLPEANICAIGGITVERLPAVKKAGAAGAAVISALFAVPDIEERARILVETWEKSPSA